MTALVGGSKTTPRGSPKPTFAGVDSTFHPIKTYLAPRARPICRRARTWYDKELNLCRQAQLSLFALNWSPNRTIPLARGWIGAKRQVQPLCELRGFSDPPSFIRVRPRRTGTASLATSSTRTTPGRAHRPSYSLAAASATCPWLRSVGGDTTPPVGVVTRDPNDTLRGRAIPARAGVCYLLGNRGDVGLRGFDLNKMLDERPD